MNDQIYQRPSNSRGVTATADDEVERQEQQEQIELTDEYLQEQEAIGAQMLAEEEMAQINRRREKLAKLKSLENRPEPKPTPLMIIAAISFDVANFIINLLPVVGGFIVSIILNPIEILIFLLWFFARGIKFAKGKRIILIAVVSATGFLPIVNLLPKWTAEMLLLTAFITAEGKLKKIVKK